MKCLLAEFFDQEVGYMEPKTEKWMKENF